VAQPENTATVQVELLSPRNRRVDLLVRDQVLEVGQVKATLDFGDDFGAGFVDDLVPVGRSREGVGDVTDGNKDDDGVAVGGSGTAHRGMSL
jgi:hypothetical protein